MLQPITEIKASPWPQCLCVRRQTHKLVNGVSRSLAYFRSVLSGFRRRVTLGVTHFPAAASANNGGWTPLHCVCYNKNVRNGIVQRLDMRIGDFNEFNIRQIIEQHMAGECQIRTVQL